MTTIVSYLLIASFFILEAQLRQGLQAKSREATETDRCSTRWVGRAFGLSLASVLRAPVLNALHVGIILWHSKLIGWDGVAIMIIRLALRVWAARVLGRFYTRTRQTVEQQRIVQIGPYRIIRHPGYLGVMLMWTGAGLAVPDWIALAVIVLITASAYIYRVQAEEAMLTQAFGQEFTAYRAKTWTLIPLHSFAGFPEWRPRPPAPCRPHSAGFPSGRAPCDWWPGGEFNGQQHARRPKSWLSNLA